MSFCRSVDPARTLEARRALLLNCVPQCVGEFQHAFVAGMAGDACVVNLAFGAGKAGGVRMEFADVDEDAVGIVTGSHRFRPRFDFFGVPFDFFPPR